MPTLESSRPAAAFESTLQHGQAWCGQDITGWYWSEKLDGCRARWTGSELRSRGGHLIALPPRMAATLPAGMALDVEVYAGCGRQELTRLAVQCGRWDAAVHLVAFDAPDCPGDWLQRIAAAQAARVPTVPRGIVDSHSALSQLLAHVQGRSGEGLIAAQPGRRYTPGRSSAALKVKDAAVFNQPDPIRKFCAAFDDTVTGALA